MSATQRYIRAIAIESLHEPLPQHFPGVAISANAVESPSGAQHKGSVLVGPISGSVQSEQRWQDPIVHRDG